MQNAKVISQVQLDISVYHSSSCSTDFGVKTEIHDQKCSIVFCLIVERLNKKT